MQARFTAAAIQFARDTTAAALPDSLRALVRGSAQVNIPSQSGWKPLLPVVVGGVIAIVAGLSAQWFKLVLEERKQKTRVKKRMVYMLQQGIVIARMCRDHDQTASVPENWMREVLVQWAAYDRIADLALFGTDRHQLELHAFLERMRMDAETIIEGQASVLRRFEEGKRSPADVVEVFRHFNKAVAIWEVNGMNFLRRLVDDREWPRVQEYFEERMRGNDAGGATGKEPDGRDRR